MPKKAIQKLNVKSLNKKKRLKFKKSIFLSVHCQWSEWWNVGSCSKTCGKGIKNVQRRKLVESSNGGNDCIGKETDQKYCNIRSCPTTISWNGSGCDVQCKASR